jgi:hypothetical protein
MNKKIFFLSHGDCEITHIRITTKHVTIICANNTNFYKCHHFINQERIVINN